MAVTQWETAYVCTKSLRGKTGLILPDRQVFRPLPALYLELQWILCFVILHILPNYQKHFLQMTTDDKIEKNKISVILKRAAGKDENCRDT